jgi:benzoylformate decarboxylase
LGAPAFTYHVEGFGPHIPAGAELFQLVDDPAMATWTPVGVAVCTSLKLGIRDLLDGPLPQPRACPATRRELPRLSHTQLTDSYLLQQIAVRRPPGSVIVEEAPSSRVPMQNYLPITERDTFYTCASGGLGYGLPAAIGIALARPKDKIIAILGDGSSMYAIQGLWTAAQLKLPITFVIINNGRYEALMQFGRLFGLRRTVGTTLPQIDFCGIARSQGCEAIYVNRAEALDAALQQAFSSRSPTLVEVIV